MSTFTKGYGRRDPSPFAIGGHPCFIGIRITKNIFGDTPRSPNGAALWHKSYMGRTGIPSYIRDQGQDTLCVMLVESGLEHVLLDTKTCDGL